MGVNYGKLLGNNTKDNNDNKSKVTTSKSLVTREIPFNYLPTNTELNSGQNINFGESKFDKGIENVELFNNLTQIRAERQPWLHQANNALWGGLGSALLTAGETVSLLLDIPSNIDGIKGYFDNEQHLDAIEGNAFANWFKEAKETLTQEYLPIYRKYPDKIIDFNDSGFYWEAFRGIIDSGAGFGLSGMGVGAAVKMTGKALRMARMGRYSNMIGKSIQKGGTGQVSTGLITNHGENKMMALELYEGSQKEFLQEYIDNYKEETGEAPSADLVKQFELDAKINAGKQANQFLLKGKAFAFIDILQLNRMFKGTTRSSRNVMKEPGVKEFLKSQFKPSMMAKEASEEIGQNTLQMELQYQARQGLVDQGYNISNTALDELSFAERLIEFATSDQALLEGAMGALGGPVQYAVTQAPFEQRGKQKERFSSQRTQFKDNENFVTGTLYNEWLGELNKAQAGFIYSEENLKEAIKNDKDTIFKTKAIRNFQMGTTAQFEELLEAQSKDERLTDLQREYVNDKIKELSKLEEQWNNNVNKYAAATEIMGLESYSDFLKKHRELGDIERTKLVTQLNDLLTDFNQANKTEYTIDDLVKNTKEFQNDKKAQKAFKEYQSVINGIQISNTNQDHFTNEVKVIGEQIQAYKTENLLIDDFNEVYENIKKVTPERIKGLKKLKKEAKSQHVKDYMDRKIYMAEQALEDSIKNESVEAKGGTDKLSNEAKKSNKKAFESQFGTENFDESVDEPSIPDNIDSMTDEEYDAIPPKLRKQIEAIELDSGLGGENQEQLSQRILDLIDSYKEESGEEVDGAVLDKLDKLASDFTIDDAKLEKLAEQAEKIIDEENDVANAEQAEALIDSKEQSKEEVTPVDPINPKEVPTESQSTRVSNRIAGKTQPVNMLDGVKTMFKKASKTFLEWMNSNTDKKGTPVEFKVDERYIKKHEKEALEYIRNNPNKEVPNDIVDKFPIQVIFDNDPNNTTNLFFVNKPKEGEEGNAWVTERQLRKDIIKKLALGQRATSKVQYQYSGAIISDGNQKNLMDLKLADKAEAIEFMYTDSEGMLRYTNGDVTNKTNPINLKTQMTAWAGQIFTMVQSPKGKTPLKLNVKKLQANEIQAIQLILEELTNPKYIAEKKNAFNNRLKDNDTIYNLVNPKDRDFLGDTATFGDVLSHLVHEKTDDAESDSNSNPATQFYVQGGRVHFGIQSNGKPVVLTHEQLKKPNNRAALTKFLTTFKNRNVSVHQLQNNEKYKALLVNEGILQTDAKVDSNGNVFHSIDTGEDSANRYKTKSIYVSNKLDNVESQPQTTSGVITSEQTFADKLQGKKPLTGKTTQSTPSKMQETESTTVEEVKRKLTKLGEKNLVVNPNDSNTYIEVDSEGNRIGTKTWSRVSTLKGDSDFSNNEAADRGTIIDEMLRAFVDNQASSVEDLQAIYDRMDAQTKEDGSKKYQHKEFTKGFIEDLHAIFEEIAKETSNLELISTIPTMWGEINGKAIAGTIDLLGIDKTTGKVFIIDLKTSTLNRRLEYQGADQYNYKGADSIQQSGYAELLAQRTGIVVSGISLLPIKVSKGAKYTLATANKDNKTGKFTLAAQVDKNIFNKDKWLKQPTTKKPIESINETRVETNSGNITIQPDGKMFYDNGKEVTQETVKNKALVKKASKEGTLRRTDFNGSNYAILPDNRIISLADSSAGAEKYKTGPQRITILRKVGDVSSQQSQVKPDVVTKEDKKDDNNLEAKEAEIERRRKEEVNNYILNADEDEDLIGSGTLDKINKKYDTELAKLKETSSQPVIESEKTTNLEDNNVFDALDQFTNQQSQDLSKFEQSKTKVSKKSSNKQDINNTKEDNTKKGDCK